MYAKNEKEKPPLGIMPKDVHNKKRVLEILEAMRRYNEVNKTIPKCWFHELEDLYEDDI